MSDPYVYTPSASNLGSGYIPTSSAYFPTSYHTPQSSPFIPSGVLPGSGSPYHSPYTSPYRNAVPLPGTPNAANQFSFPTTYEPNEVFDSYYGPTRPRRPSWHAPVQTNDPYLSVGDPFGRDRRRSFGGSAEGYGGYGGYGSSPYAWAGGPYTAYANSNSNSNSNFGIVGGGSPYQQNAGLHSPGHFHLHPWLNAEAWRGDFLFDLSSHYFNPIQVLSHTRRDNAFIPNETRLAPMEIMMQPAAHPGLTRLRVVCDMIPQWPVDLSFNNANQGGSNPGAVGFTSSIAPPGVQPITLVDVLTAIHRSMHTRITHADWANLNSVEEAAVSRAYTQRCKALGHAGSLYRHGVYTEVGISAGAFGPEMEQAEFAQGVKRVDFLLGKNWFKGVVVDWAEGIVHMVVS